MVKTFLLRTHETLNLLLAQEDTDGDKKITKEDKGPQAFSIQSVDGKPYEIKGTYYLSNLLQELALAIAKGQDTTEIPLSKIEELPANRISRMIREVFWDDLTRTIDEKGIKEILGDTKSSDGVERIYVPYKDAHGIRYFKNLEKKLQSLQVEILPEKISPDYVRSINTSPGILALKLEDDKGVPFVVPGGRFNEMYGWDSYFEGIGLLIDGRIDLAKGMVDNFCYQIEHYGKILNANRSYYLTRTQPPFLSSFIREVYEADSSVGHDWLSNTLETAIKEYETVWMVSGKRMTSNGLNRYMAEGIGIPPETEAGHFSDVLKKYADKHQISTIEFEKKYKAREIIDLDLDRYFVHDRSLRESGHDTSWRLDGKCADLNTVDLNSLLYKYETDFEYLVDTYYKGSFTTSAGKIYKSLYFTEKAQTRKKLMYKSMWDPVLKGYFDYNFKTDEKTGFGSATNFYPLWAGLCNKEQAAAMVISLMCDFIAKGGILATSKASILPYSKKHAQRQWDYPNGWAPHQMLLWKGLLNYQYQDEAQELIYRWLWMITRNAVDYNGTIPEKYDVVNCTHKVYAEYGNVGTEFDYITTSGFGWMNASYQYGLNLLSPSFIDKLNALQDPDTVF